MGVKGRPREGSCRVDGGPGVDGAKLNLLRQKVSHRDDVVAFANLGLGSTQLQRFPTTSTGGAG